MRYFLFEFRHWLRQPMTWVFLIINALMIFGATTSDNIRVGGSFGNVLKNSPFVIQQYYSVMSIITLLMTTAFISASTLRDFTYQTHQIIFSTPVRRAGYLLGRFFGAVAAAVIPLTGISLGILIGSVMPWVEPEKIGPVIWEAHISSILFIAFPNVLFTASVVFMVASVSRNSMTSFISSLVLLVLTVIAGNLAEDLEKEWMAIFADPFGVGTFSVLTKYWTVHDKNTMVMGSEGLFLLNRILWVAVSLLITLFTFSRFSFTEKNKAGKQAPIKDEVNGAGAAKALPAVSMQFDRSAAVRLLRYETFRELKDVITSPAFIVIMIAGLLNFLASIWANPGPYGLSAYPVTWDMINNIQGSFYTFLVAIITIYSGQLVWKEKDNRMDEIYDATPHPTWVTWLSKYLAVVLLIIITQLVLMFFCVSTQLAQGFHDVRLGVYVMDLLVIDLTGLMLITLVSMMMHTFINNKYIAFFAFVAFLILDSFIWGVFDIESNMVSYGGRPSYTYSDMNGYGPYLPGIFWFRVYWYLFAAMLALLVIMFWTRGKEFSFKSKMASFRQRFTPAMKSAMLVLCVLWLAAGAYVFYNTKVLNEIITSDDMEKNLANYEKKYKKYEKVPQPRITAVSYKIDLYPEDRKLDASADLWIQNKNDVPVDSIHFTLPVTFETTITLPGSKRVLNDEDLNYVIYKLDKPLMPGDSLQFSFHSVYDAKGFENEVSFTSVVDNGSFFNSMDFSPSIGYQSGGELRDRDKRKDYELPPADRMPKLERNCSDACMNNYISNQADWVRVQTEISTSDDQIAVAPGSLVKQWKSDGRNHYVYRLEQKALYFYSFISARYEVKREKYKGLDVEVYYDKRHPYNVDKMARSMKRSLDYYTTHFGPYYHKQVRIIEFPRYASFAQAFPGTMPYSEGIGFIARIEDEEDIDMVFYVVAHEMAHQYWAHQVIGAEMQGATVLSESFSQYSALMVMEKEYGRDKMRKFLKYEMDNYLNQRGSEELKEMPLMQVENQGYIHYRKASLVLYYLREMIGEQQMNSALRSLITQYAYQEPPYPTVHSAVDAFRSSTPDSLKYLITDLFETITVYNNRATASSMKKIGTSGYEVTIEYDIQKFRADSLGKQTPLAADDWIEVGVYGKPEDEKSLGKVMYSGLHRITSRKGTIKVMVDSIPYQAGVDPRNLMVDLVGDDNLVKVN